MLHQQTDYDSLTYNIRFIMMVWNGTHNVSEVWLYLVTELDDTLRKGEEKSEMTQKF